MRTVQRERSGPAAPTAAPLELLGPTLTLRYAASQNTRSQRALERLGFRREGVLAAWHRHGDRVYDVVSYGMVRAAWERSGLPAIPAQLRGTLPSAFVMA